MPSRISASRFLRLGRAWTREMLTGVLQFDQIHLIFDPGRKSHPKAEEVHPINPDEVFGTHKGRRHVRVAALLTTPPTTSSRPSGISIRPSASAPSSSRSSTTPSRRAGRFCRGFETRAFAKPLSLDGMRTNTYIERTCVSDPPNNEAAHQPSGGIHDQDCLRGC